MSSLAVAASATRLAAEPATDGRDGRASSAVVAAVAPLAERCRRILGRRGGSGRRIRGGNHGQADQGCGNGFHGVAHGTPGPSPLFVHEEDISAGTLESQKRQDPPGSSDELSRRVRKCSGKSSGSGG